MKALDTKKAMVCLSGGLDSTYCLYWAKRNYDEVFAVSFDYGQRHSIELEAAKRIAVMAGIGLYEVIDLKGVFKAEGPLMGTEEVTKYDSFEDAEEETKGIDAPTFVPARNSMFAVVAASRAMLRGAGTVVLGVCEADDAGYPDCRKDWVEALRDFLQAGIGTTTEIKVATPLLSLTKKETVLRAYHDLREAYDAWEWSHTAYDGSYPPGNDHASLQRAAAFAEAGLPDPLILRAAREGRLGRFPDTDNYNGVRTVVE